MRSVWRITTAALAEAAFTGEGARLYGGRWNPEGMRVVYTSAHRSLAMLEMLVQDLPLRARYVLIEARIPERVATEHVAIANLPAGWRTLAARSPLQALGARWLERGRTAVLAVPSVVVPGEPNFLLNPLHPDFRRIRIGMAESIDTDLRLITRSTATTSTAR